MSPDHPWNSVSFALTGGEDAFGDSLREIHCLGDRRTDEETQLLTMMGITSLYGNTGQTRVGKALLITAHRRGN
jgi:hypothetical protein